MTTAVSPCNYSKKEQCCPVTINNCLHLLKFAEKSIWVRSHHKYLHESHHSKVCITMTERMNMFQFIPSCATWVVFLVLFQLEDALTYSSAFKNNCSLLVSEGTIPHLFYFLIIFGKSHVCCLSDMSPMPFRRMLLVQMSHPFYAWICVIGSDRQEEVT